MEIDVHIHISIYCIHMHIIWVIRFNSRALFANGISLIIKFNKKINESVIYLHYIYIFTDK